jgi:hypothetical protein
MGDNANSPIFYSSKERYEIKQANQQSSQLSGTNTELAVIVKKESDGEKKDQPKNTKSFNLKSTSSENVLPTQQEQNYDYHIFR